MMEAQQYTSQKTGCFLGGSHKPTEHTQAVQQFGHLLSVTEKLWPIITACCVTPWLPDHEASQPELPEELSALQALAAAVHSKCMASDQFMATIQQQAARMTARQTEQLQVLLCAMEDFSFADFLHLAVYHKRDIFAPSPVGVSPRTWNSDSMHPALSRPAQHLPDCSAASSNHRHTRVSRRSPIGAKMALAGTENGEKAKNDTEAERVRSIEVPEMEKWAKLLQSGGLSRRVHTKHASMATLAGLARMKRRAASARRSLAMQHPLVLPKAGSQVSGESSGKGLALEVCRPSKAVLQSWDEKVFPGEGIGFESARDKTFTGLKGMVSRQKAASSLGFANSNPRLPPVSPLSAGGSPAWPPALRANGDKAIDELQGSGVPQASLATSSVGPTRINEKNGDNAFPLAGCSTAAVGGASFATADSRVDLAEANGGNIAAHNAQALLAIATSSPSPDGHQSHMLPPAPNSRRLSLASPNAATVTSMTGGRAALLDDGTRAGAEEEEQTSDSAGDSPEQAEDRHLESPGRFGAAQFMLMQQRQQQLQADRLAALEEEEKTGYIPAVYSTLQQSRQQQSSSSLASLQPVWPCQPSAAVEPAAKHAQHGHVEADAVVSSPVVLFSPGGPYCDKSRYYMSAAMMQGQADRGCSITDLGTLGSAMAPRTGKVPFLGLPASTGQPGKSGVPLPSVSRRGSLLDAETLITGSRTGTSAKSNRKGRSSNAPAAVADSDDSDRAESLDSSILDSSAAATAAARKPPRPCKTQPAEEQQHLHAEASFLQIQQHQPWMRLNGRSNAVAESADKAQLGQANRTTVAASFAAHTNRADVDLKAVRSQTSIPFAVEPLVSLPNHKSMLKSAASTYAAAGVVDALFTPRDTYVNGDAAPMTKARHHFGLSSEQVAADIEKQKQFASSLASWYKLQLKRRARNSASGGRALSRSNSKTSD